MDANPTNSIGSRLIELRKTLKKSQTDFAELLQTTVQTIGNIEKNRTEPAFKNFQLLAQAIPALNLRWLIFGEGEMWEKEKPAGSESMRVDSTQVGVGNNLSVHQSAITEQTVAQLRQEVALLRGMVQDKDMIIELLKQKNQK